MLTLETKIEEIPKIGLAYQKRLKKLGIENVKDLLFYFPSRYEDFSNIMPIKNVKVGYMVCVQGKIIKKKHYKTFKKWMDITEIIIEDETGPIKALWFNQPYLANSLKEDDFICLAGKVNLGKDGIYLNNPAYEKLSNTQHLTPNLTHTGRIIPVYSETRGLTSRWLRYIVKPLLINFYNKIPEVLPYEIIKKYQFLPIKKAIWQVHFPDSFESADAAKYRFSFEELFLLQLSVLKERFKLMQTKAFACPMDVDLMKKFTKSLPFHLTDSQKQCSWQILKDLEKSVPMSRLLEGDVGSGKTVVATMAALNVVKNRHQVAFMAPTEILAKQHFSSIAKLLENFDLRIGLLTSKESKICDVRRSKTIVMSDVAIISKQSLLEDLKNGQIDILIGTHSLLQKNVEFKSLAFVIVDEQHRFGIAQRAKLIGCGSNAETTRNYAESAENTKELLYENLTYKIRGAAFNVRKLLGSGHSELVYQRSIAEEMRNMKLNFTREKKIDIKYKGKKIGIYQPDFIVEDSVIVELKALPFLGTTVKSQIWKYLKGSNYKLALILNFSSIKLEIERLIYDEARDINVSASILHSSTYIPHLLSMTATPIPRTLALSIYGDLDLSLIKEMPKNRKKVKTLIVEPKDRKRAYEFIRNEVKEGKGVFVICPKIENKIQDTRYNNQTYGSFAPQNYNFNSLLINDIKAVKEEYEKLSKEIFPDLRITMLYGKMKPKEKERIMQDFQKGEIDILVSTSVVEVGVDVPRATVMMIEGAERFGLAQLHQFRGRVGRSEIQSYCFLFTTTPDQLNRKRLKALVASSNGFELAQKDLEIRGPGQLYGTQQWGDADISMQNLANIFLVEKTRQAAKEILEKDPSLTLYPLLKERLKRFAQRIHFE